MKRTCRTCENTLCRFVEPEENWDKPNDCEQWRPFISKNDITKTNIIRALHILVAHCDAFQDDDTYWNRCNNEDNPCECIFWETCYYDANCMCSTLRIILEELEND